jgi:oligosaccharide reducing-end xylanase
MKIKKRIVGFTIGLLALASCGQQPQNSSSTVQPRATLLTHKEAETMTSGGGCTGIQATAVTYYCNNDSTFNSFTFAQTGRFTVTVRGASTNAAAAGISVLVAGTKVAALSFTGTAFASASQSFDLATSGSKEIRLKLETDNGSNDTLIDWYEIAFEGATPPPPPPPTPSSTGAYASGVHRNLVKEWNSSITDAQITAKLDAYWNQLFTGTDNTQRVYYPDGSNANGALGYIYNEGQNAGTDMDVRSEGMSYGMMIAVQMNKKAVFDALWNWAQSFMLNSTGYRSGHFAWRVRTDHLVIDANPAPDGEEYFTTALFFAGNRWGNGTGIYNYTAQANNILNAMLHKEDMNGGLVNSYHNLFDPTNKMVVFSPDNLSASYSDPSYHLPAFYELWGLWATGYNGLQTQDRQFWKDAAARSRLYFSQTTNANGLAPDYADFNGQPHCCGDHQDFRFDAWRTAMNWAVDHAWWAKNPSSGSNAITLSNRILGFFDAQGVNTYGNNFKWTDSTPFNTDHSVGLVAMNAASTLSSNNSVAWKFVEAFWNSNLETGAYRYYNDLLAFMGMLHITGNFKIYAPGTVSSTAPAAPSSLASSAASSSQINLTWLDNSSNETGFKIERKSGTAAFAQIATVGAGVISYSNTALTASTAYTYRVRATNSVGDSAYSNESSAITSSVTTGTVPTAPSSLGSTVASSSQINLSWFDNSNNETGFKIERKTGAGAYAQIATVAANITTYNNTALTASTAYTYRVRANNATGDSAYSNETTATTSSGTTTANRDAYTMLEAESFNAQLGATIEAGDSGSVANLASSSSYIVLNGVNFGSSGAASVEFRINTPGFGTNLQVRIGSQTATVFCTVYPAGGGAWETKSNSCFLPTKPTGLQSVYVTVTGAAKINWLRFTP